MRRVPSLWALLAVVAVTGADAQDEATAAATDPAGIPTIRAFVGDGFGARNPEAPVETEQFGRLAGLWTVEAEMADMAGNWVPSAPGVWAWKYALDGFAVRDLFYQSADNLPPYMAKLGRDYLLTASRIYDVASQRWQVAWMANGAGQAMGADFGTFTAVLEDGAIVMTSEPGAFGIQRVVFHDLGADSFRWKSEYSMDGGNSWRTVMRMLAHRHDGRSPAP